MAERSQQSPSEPCLMSSGSGSPRKTHHGCSKRSNGFVPLRAISAGRSHCVTRASAERSAGRSCTSPLDQLRPSRYTLRSEGKNESSTKEQRCLVQNASIWRSSARDSFSCVACRSSTDRSAKLPSSATASLPNGGCDNGCDGGCARTPCVAGALPLPNACPHMEQTADPLGLSKVHAGHTRAGRGISRADGAWCGAGAQPRARCRSCPQTQRLTVRELQHTHSGHFQKSSAPCTSLARGVGEGAPSLSEIAIAMSSSSASLSALCSGARCPLLRGCGGAPPGVVSASKRWPQAPHTTMGLAPGAALKWSWRVQCGQFARQSGVATAGSIRSSAWRMWWRPWWRWRLSRGGNALPTKDGRGALRLGGRDGGGAKAG
mmetsp:Transcript_33463/g.83423  ORF Transcript_33463/g.83423 Transcript_33463/m.83423 type:complete len:376 (-) Transcript_33463:131-1258(-)